MEENEGISHRLAHYLRKMLKKNDNVEEEIKLMLNEGQEQGMIMTSKAEMLAKVLDFSNKDAGDIMKHRTDIVALSGDMNVDDAAKIVLDDMYSRYPVYEEDLHNIVGVVHFKDVIRYYVSKESNNIPIKNLVREAYFVPETIHLDVLFKEMKTKKLHMAVVIDEYGQTAGIVAMEDMLEEIVGDIEDEYDLEETQIQQINDGIYLVDGLTRLSEVTEEIGIEFDTEDYDTLNGFVISRLERIPAPGECLEFTYDGYQFITELVEDKLVKTVRISSCKDQNSDEGSD